VKQQVGLELGKVKCFNHLVKVAHCQGLAVTIST